MSKPMEFTDANFEKEVLKSDVPVLVDFWAPWCGPCKMIGPIIEELANDYAGKFKVGKVNTDENMQISTKYGIRSIPTLGIFLKGEMVDSIIGALPKKSIADKMEAHLTAA
ncbi:MAG: thioredoxin [Bacteroidetes bacterium]|nr:thioredoxin [Bacteroidota bacterium]